MLCLALRSNAERIYQRALRQFRSVLVKDARERL
jgi:hypothetical protein